MGISSTIISSSSSCCLLRSSAHWMSNSTSSFYYDYCHRLAVTLTSRRCYYVNYHVNCRCNMDRFKFHTCREPMNSLLCINRTLRRTNSMDTILPINNGFHSLQCCSLRHMISEHSNIQKFYHTSGVIRNLDNKHISSEQPSSLFETSDQDTLWSLSKDMLVYNDFVSEEEEESLLSEIGPYMKKLRYEYDHWDDAIHGYRETEKKKWNADNEKILQRVRELAFPPDVPSGQLAYVHILDLEKTGYIKPHIDSVRFCGCTITGISLLSDTVMRLENAENKSSWAKILLKRRSLYIMKGIARYKYTHAVLADEHSTFKQQRIPRERRISIICRNEAPDLDGFSTPDTNTAQRY